MREESEYADPLRTAPISTPIFPSVLAKRSQSLGPGALAFANGLCHRCNLKPPSLAYCHAMYGGAFKQTYGWYINQTCLRLGVGGTQPIDFLDGVCPDDLRREAALCKEAFSAYLAELKILNALVYGPERSDIAPDEITYWHNVKIEEAEPMVMARRKAEKLKTALSNRLENITRQEFGFHNVGEGWVSETLLAQIVERLFPGKHIIRHDRPDWLEGLELDIHIPGLGLAFEYQGQQHFHPIKAWGGQEALQAVQERDRRKLDLCKERGLCLIVVDYTEPLTEPHIKRRLIEAEISGIR